MRKYIFIFAILGFVVAYAAGDWISIQSAKSITKSTLAYDTVTPVSLKFKENVELQTFVTGSDSIRFDYYIDGIIGTKYINLVTDSLKVVSSSSDHARTILLRGYGTNKIPGVENVRIRVKRQAGADSSAPITYTMKLLWRD